MQVSCLLHRQRLLTRGRVQRVYGVSFPSKELMEDYKHRMEEAKRRDHRNVGVQQQLFFFNPISPGSCFFLPHGARIYNTLIQVHGTQQPPLTCRAQSSEFGARFRPEPGTGSRRMPPHKAGTMLCCSGFLQPCTLRMPTMRDVPPDRSRLIR